MSKNVTFCFDFGSPYSYLAYNNLKVIKKYNSYAYTCIIKHKNISNNSATQIFTKKGPIAFLPVSKNETSIVYSFNDIKLRKTENIKALIQKYNFKYESGAARYNNNDINLIKLIKKYNLTPV